MKNILTRATTVLSLALCAHTAAAFDLTNSAIQSLGQDNFRLLAEDLSAALSYKPMIPAADLGITGFDLGVSVSATKIANKDVLKQAASGASVPSAIPIVAIRAAKGLPFGLNVGASYSNLPGTPLSAIGGDLRWAVLPGSTLMPAVSVRLSMSKSTGIDEITTRSTGYDVSVSKGFTLLTPYAGIGRVESKVNAPGTTLTREKVGQTKYFAGVNANLGLMNLAVEGDRTGKASTYGVKVGFRF
ncbi:MAG: hypothetical protein ACK4F8_06940 [Aquabacterium sp.]